MIVFIWFTEFRSAYLTGCWSCWGIGRSVLPVGRENSTICVGSTAHLSSYSGSVFFCFLAGLTFLYSVWRYMIMAPIRATTTNPPRPRNPQLRKFVLQYPRQSSPLHSDPSCFPASGVLLSIGGCIEGGSIGVYLISQPVSSNLFLPISHRTLIVGFCFQ